jgi:hypothetical protein
MAKNPRKSQALSGAKGLQLFVFKKINADVSLRAYDFF